VFSTLVLLHHLHMCSYALQSGQCRNWASNWTVRDLNPGREKRFFCVSKSSRPALGPAQAPIPCVGGSFPWGKAAGARC